MDSAQDLDIHLQKLEEKVKTANLPLDLSEKLNSMISMLSTGLKSNGNLVNYQLIENYINWVCLLPFNDFTKDNTNIENAKKILDKNHYGLESVKMTILEYISSLILNMQNGIQTINAPILCLVGLVGTGKTTLAYSIAEALGRKYERVPFGGMGDAISLRGQSRAFADAEPGVIIKKLISAKSKNCVILLDELDRVSEGSRNDIMGVLVELLDPEQNKNFVDHYIDYPFDLSNVLFVATANNTTNIATAVLDRMEVIQMPSYSDAEKMVIAKDYLLSKITKATGLKENQLQVSENLWPTIIRPLGYDSGMRSLEKSIETICRRAALLIVQGKIGKDSIIQITDQNIKQFLLI